MKEKGVRIAFWNVAGNEIGTFGQVEKMGWLEEKG